jgi:hypothetical protein
MKQWMPHSYQFSAAVFRSDLTQHSDIRMSSCQMNARSENSPPDQCVQSGLNCNSISDMHYSLVSLCVCVSVCYEQYF